MDYHSAIPIDVAINVAEQLESQMAVSLEGG